MSGVKGRSGGSRVGAGRPRKCATSSKPISYEFRRDVWLVFKVCTLCGIDKHRDEFSKKNKDGKVLCPKCKTCVASKSADYYRENPEKCKAAVKRWEQENPEKATAANRKWALENKAYVSEYSKNKWNFEGGRERGREINQKQISLVSDGYAAKLIGLVLADCPAQLIDMKRAQILLKRETYALNKTLKATT